MKIFKWEIISNRKRIAKLEAEVERLGRVCEGLSEKTDLRVVKHSPEETGRLNIAGVDYGYLFGSRWEMQSIPLSQAVEKLARHVGVKFSYESGTPAKVSLKPLDTVKVNAPKPQKK